MEELKSKVSSYNFIALEYAVKGGAVSWVMLKKLLKVEQSKAKEILNWMIEQGYVKNEGCIDQYKTTLMSQEEFQEFLKINEKYKKKTKRERQRTVDDFLYKASLRLFLREGVVNKSLLVNRLAINSIKANAVVDKMEEDGFARINRETLTRELVITKEQFKDMFGEEI